MSFIERSNIHCPFLLGSTIGGSTVVCVWHITYVCRNLAVAEDKYLKVYDVSVGIHDKKPDITISLGKLYITIYYVSTFLGSHRNFTYSPH